MKKRRIIIILLVIVFILLIPLVAMQFNDEVDWSLGDFILAGVLLIGAGLLYELVMTKVGRTTYGWMLGIIFFVIGILNMFLVHLVPGAFYLIFSFIYFPPIVDVIKNKFNILIPYKIKIIFALLVLWATLAVGDLAEIFGL